METLHIDCSGGGYDILISPESWSAAALPGRKMLVCDSNVAELHGEKVRRILGADDLFVFPAGEASKRIDNVIALCRRAAELHFDRHCSFVALGGGVTGDLTGFAAAIYLRGVKVMQIPTSLLAMVDSSVGGKTAVDIPEGKNLVGAFHQPCRVVIDPEFLRTLPVAELRNGLAEVVKTAVLGDAPLFDELERAGAELVEAPLPLESYQKIILACCRVKGRIVAADEHEHGCRAFLNYGHTFGHALELLSGFAMPHGVGVAIGMVVAAKLAVKLGTLDPHIADRQEKLLRAVGLPTQVSVGTDPEKWFSAMASDKKVRDGRIVLILPERIGAVREESAVPAAMLRAFLREMCS